VTVSSDRELGTFIEGFQLILECWICEPAPLEPCAELCVDVVRADVDLRREAVCNLDGLGSLSHSVLRLIGGGINTDPKRAQPLPTFLRRYADH